MTDITYIGLGIGLLLMIIPLWFLGKMRTGLVHPTISATMRMIIQLFLIGLYLQYLFEYDLWYVNLAWALIMVFVAANSRISNNRTCYGIILPRVYSSTLRCK